MSNFTHFQMIEFRTQSIVVTWQVVVIVGVGVAIVLGFLYIIFMRFCAGCVVWTAIIAILLVIFTLGGWCYIKSGWIPSTWLEFVTNQLAEVGIVTDFLIKSASNKTFEAVATLDVDISAISNVSDLCKNIVV